MAFQPKVGRYVLNFGPTSHIYVFLITLMVYEINIPE